ncbi:HlyD family secretion protein [Paradevosia shaoguanensis]|uniref:HlyD family secretion protein n=1 Tax=Paradevosia shaoguanensis TaxID=1335043 RepID=A0AA41QKX1_9HYPH|nr:HlyD family secretion protein [Paradevosia shaoguanensis]MCF1740892.1 HlyD family secretion protein [Paradevosia shaoguanensis]MCI0125376.1 HlyD family secretion protein [Paradevosia shaoguanensis]
MNARVTEPKQGEAVAVDAPKVAEAKPAPEPAPAAPQPKKRNPRRIVLMAVVPVILVAGGAWFYLNGGRYEETDNAYVQQAKVAISADIAGRITTVNVIENQTVKAGDALFTIDPESYQIALDQATAALASARVNVEQLRVAYGTAQAALKAAQTTLDIQQVSYDRQSALVDQGVNSSAALDQPKLSLQQAQTAVVTAQQQVAAAAAALAGDPNIATDKHPAVLAALAQVEAAKRNLNKTKVVAPADGIVANVSSLNPGQFVAAGTTIASLVETNGLWIEANFKETQLTGIRVGQPAEIKVDAYPGVVFEGKVESIGAATGSEFSLIPAQNATGNWVKVVQRIPIRIALGPETSAEALRTGMSTVVSVDTGASTLDKMLGK